MYHQVANQRQILHGIIQRLKLILDDKERKYAKPMRQIPFTLHQNAGDANKQVISEGEGLLRTLHPPSHPCRGIY